MVARLKAAHNREIRDVSQQQYDRGFHAGRHSMDAEHRAIAMRLRGLRFDGGSHENLSRIAYAIYPCATGWTCESCDGLRDELIRLMGGVHDDPVPVGEPSGAGCADCDCGAGESRRVSERDSQESPNLADSDGEDGGKVTITEELRKSLREIAEHMGVPHDRDLTDYSDEAVIDAINWHIDSYYQINIDELQAQVIECCKQRDKARERAINDRNSLCDTQRRVKVKCDELQRVLNTIRAVVLDE
jgi:hypothetical protein